MSTFVRLSAMLLAVAAWLPAADLLLKPGDRIAVIGDSITEQRLYTRFIEVYLIASSGIAELDVAQFGWYGEHAGGWVNRGAASIDWFKPTVATTCYGMNDGGYTAYTDAIGTKYRAATAANAEQLQKAGVRDIVLGSPGAVDSVTFRRPVGAAVYNANLAQLGELVKAVAVEKGVRYADVHHPMLAAMARAKAAYGDNYHIGGGDGVHPDHNGHLLMAAAFLTALGCDGEIARITMTVDGTAKASAGRSVTTAVAGVVELDSTRWPYALSGNGRSPDSTRSIAPYTDFHEKLNRFVVAMPDCPWPRAKVTWGGKDVTVEGAQLKTGINLMELFTATPFDAPMEGLHQAVAAQQEVETILVKVLIHLNWRSHLEADAASKALFQQLIERQIVLRHEKAVAARALLKPVHHRIVVAAAP